LTATKSKTTKKKVNKTTTKPKLNANNDRQTTRKTAAKPKKTTTTSRETKSNALTPIDTPGDKSVWSFLS